MRPHPLPLPRGDILSPLAENVLFFCSDWSAAVGMRGLCSWLADSWRGADRQGSRSTSSFSSRWSGFSERLGKSRGACWLPGTGKGVTAASFLPQKWPVRARRGRDASFAMPDEGPVGAGRGAQVYRALQQILSVAALHEAIPRLRCVGAREGEGDAAGFLDFSPSNGLGYKSHSPHPEYPGALPLHGDVGRWSTTTLPPPFSCTPTACFRQGWDGIQGF